MSQSKCDCLSSSTLHSIHKPVFAVFGLIKMHGDFSAVQLWQVHPCPFPLCCKLVRFDTWVTVAQLWSCTCAFACVHLCTLGHESGKPTAHRSMCQTIWCVATFSNNRKRNHGRFPFYYWSQDRPIHNMHCPEELLAAILFQKCLQTRFFLLSELKASSTKKWIGDNQSVKEKIRTVFWYRVKSIYVWTLKKV